MRKMGKRRITQGERWQIIAHIKERTKSNREIARLIGVSDNEAKVSSHWWCKGENEAR